MVGVEYTGNETHDDYNEYYYVEKAPFGAENVRSYRYRGLIRDPHRKKSKRRDYSGVRRKAIKEMLGFGAETSDYSQTGNVAAEVTVGYEWTIYDMDDDDIDNDELLALIDSAVQDHIIYEYENERDPSSQGVTYVNYVNEDEKVEELNVYYRYDVNVELGAEETDEFVVKKGRHNKSVVMQKTATDEAVDKRVKQGLITPEEGKMLKSIKNEEERLRKYTQLQRKNDPTYRKDFPWYYYSEGYEPEPLNMQGAVGVLIALAGVVLYKL